MFLDGVRVPHDSVVGGVGNGFGVILEGMNAERILIASECIGDGSSGETSIYLLEIY